MRSSVSALIATEQQGRPAGARQSDRLRPRRSGRSSSRCTAFPAPARTCWSTISPTAKVIDRINGWVKEKTHDLIPEIIGEAPETLGLVAVNALYFKDKWQTPFEPSRTRPEPFQTTSGKPVDVQMMHSKVGKFRFRQDDRFIATELGYAHDNFRLVVATTKSAPAPARDFAPVAGWLDGKGFAAQNGEVALPKLSLSSTGELLPPLDAFGLKAARGTADRAGRIFRRAAAASRASCRRWNCASTRRAPKAPRRPPC